MAFFVFFWLLFCVLCAWSARFASLWCASCWTRLSGVVQWRHYLWNHWRECQAAHEIACYLFWFGDVFIGGKPYVLALVRRPSLHGDDACVVYWITEAFRRICRRTKYQTSFSPFSSFSV